MSCRSLVGSGSTLVSGLHTSQYANTFSVVSSFNMFLLLFPFVLFAMMDEEGEKGEKSLNLPMRKLKEIWMEGI